MEWDWENVTAFLLVVGGLITAISPILISLFQSQTKKPNNEAERSKTISESWQLLVGELQEEIDRYRSEREMMITNVAHLNQKVEELETEIDEQKKKYDSEMQRQAIEYANKEQGLKATIDDMQERINELETKQQSLKRTTDELEKKTGPLPPLPQDDA